MILEKLRDLHARIEDDILPSYHKRQKVRWILEIAADGRFLGFTETGKTKSTYTEIDAPYARRSGSKPPPYLLVDRPGYVIGLPRGDSKKQKEKAAWRHTAYVELVQACAEEIDEEAFEGLLAFLEHHVAKACVAAKEKEMGAGDLIAPRVDGVLLTKLRPVRRFWQRAQDRAAEEKSELEAECLLCGETKPVARTHPVELRVGPDPAPLITTNEPAFESYGLKQSEVAALCQPCARTYGEALSFLLNDEAHRLRLGGVTWLFWTREPAVFRIATLLSAPEPQDVEALLASPRKGRLREADVNRFYALAVSSNKRMVVRSWLTMTLPEVQKNLADYFGRQRLVVYGEAKTHGLYALAASTVRDLNKDLPPQTVPALLEHALTGRSLPMRLLHQAVQRARAEREHVMTHPRAALIKMVLLSQPNPNEALMVDDTLNPNHASPAYQCGRLLAVLDSIQERAVGANATLVDRYYGAASATPASVFGTLMRGAQNHLGKIRREAGGLHHYFQNQIGEIVSGLDGFPRTLSMEEQGLFALGFYQQKHRPSKKDETGSEAVEGSSD